VLIHDTPTGALAHDGNELYSDSKVDDPAAYRLGAPPTQRGLGKLSGDIIEQGGVRHEVVLVQFKQTENAQNQIDGKGGEFYLGLAKENAGTTDDAMVDVLTATVKDGFRFKLPVYAPNLGGSSGAYANDMWSPNGLYVTQQQDDGNFVTYRLSRPYDKGANPVAVWSAWSGPTGQ
jgi:hypothetical protein